MSLAHNGFPAPGWRWLKARLWGLEHAFERAKAAGKAEDDTRIRIFFVLALFAAGFLTLAAGATRMALFPADHGSDFAGPVGAARADIVDRNGAMLAADLLHYGLYVDPREIWDLAETRRALHAALPDLPLARLDKALNSPRRTFLVGGLTPDVRGGIHDLGLPGVTFEPESKRVYPLGQTAAHLIGFADTGGEGLSGAEKALNDPIRLATTNHQSVPLSIDLRVQAALEDEVGKAAASFGAKGAVGIVTNVHTGEILGLASYPTFDPNQAGKSSPDAMLNRAASSVYEMGSTFKVFTIAMGLDSGTTTLTSTFDASQSLTIGGQTIHDYHKGDHVLSVADIFIHSSNIGTSKIALQAGGGTLTKYFRAFGLMKAAPIELTESARPILPRTWNDNAIASSSFGQAISVSPIAVAAGMGSILNGGTYVPLTIRPMKPGARPTGPRVVSEETSRAMLDLMRVNVVRGTGGKADAPGLRVGGKTGSAEKAMGGHYVRDKLVASFAAVFPADGPLEADRYFVLILMDEPNGTPETYGFRTGGWTAAPAAGRVIDRIAPFLGVSRRMDAFDAQPKVVATQLLADDH
ncbi:peptidoglycan D,D-transpeptidase FtsI family protein [Phenylobacterium aquaticum]|uniref:peptidoglycan D,D-transpeptidase FtsI family protein n=1 Tax=Phenylobacterium aquaticum TaxID=1763816 RepID=UPI001F5D3D19|nr:penicillin-binding protein 2 [Phenylobacterium aquaticum]MCI3133421.1 penicillin-binding protein 2 [Phenylobacterium aquaticum]